MSILVVGLDQQLVNGVNGYRVSQRASGALINYRSQLGPVVGRGSALHGSVIEHPNLFALGLLQSKQATLCYGTGHCKINANIATRLCPMGTLLV